MLPKLKNIYTAPEFRHHFPQETDQVEFKSGLGRTPLQEAAVAFSNTDGGLIFVGIDDSGRVTGRRADQAAHETINESLLAAYDIGRYRIQSVAIDEVHVIALAVQPRTEGFSQTSDGRTLVRKGPRNQFLIGTDLRAFISERSLQRFESASSGMPLETVDRELLVELAHARGWDPEGPAIADRLRERGLVRGEQLTISGALMLTRPEKTMGLQKCIVEVRRYPREGVDYDRREVFDGPLHHQVRKASEFVSEELGTDLVVSGLYRYDLPKLPAVVVREAIANAVAHRSYEIDRTPVIVELREDRVVVRSPGGLPEPVTVETIRVAQAARNPTIIDTLRAFALSEDAGRGVDVMQDSMKEALLDAPEFIDTGNLVTVSLPLRGPITQRERGWIQGLEREGKLEPNDRLILIHAARGESLSNSSAREILGLSDSTESRRILQRLRDTGMLTQIGERSAARYILADEIAAPAAYRMSSLDLARMVVEAASRSPITNSHVRELTGLNANAASRLLRNLINEGKLEMMGSKRGASYTAI